MSKCPGIHCDGCGKGGGSAGAFAVVILLVIIASAGRAIGHAVNDLVSTVETIMIVTASVIGGLSLAAGGLLAVRYTVRARARTRALARPATAPVLSAATIGQAVTEPHRAAVGAPRQDHARTTADREYAAIQLSERIKNR